MAQEKTGGEENRNMVAMRRMHRKDHGGEQRNECTTNMLSVNPHSFRKRYNDPLRNAVWFCQLKTVERTTISYLRDPQLMLHDETNGTKLMQHRKWLRRTNTCSSEISQDLNVHFV